MMRVEGVEDVHDRQENTGEEQTTGNNLKRYPS